MTALATLAGMIPLRRHYARDRRCRKPLAIAVIGGILASMVWSLIVTLAVHFDLQRTT
jgi:multidrug efflux pump subunit AcrB